MQSDKYSSLVSKWNEILAMVSKFGGEVREIIIQPPASVGEIENKEKTLGISLPLSYREILLNFSRHVEFRWFLPKSANLPMEFREIFSGEIAWSLDWLEDLTPLAQDWDDLELRGKLQFCQVGNGDILAFDLGSDKEPNIIYWSHEGEGVTILADSFTSYLEKITDLYGVGSELWQLEPFLDAQGLNTTGLSATRWKNWFAEFSLVTFDPTKDDLDGLLKYVEYHGDINEQQVKVLKSFEKDLMFQKVIHRLEVVDNNQKRILYQIIGEVLNTHVSDWVRSLWDKDSDVDDVSRSYLTSKCLDENEGLIRVISFVESTFTDKVKFYEASKHLCFFRNNKVIEWIKGYISSTTTKDDWFALYACSQPTWENIVEWLVLGGKYRMVVINALEYMIDSWTSPYIEGKYKIVNPPTKASVIQVLERVREEELLKSKKKTYDKIIKDIDLLL